MGALYPLVRNERTKQMVAYHEVRPHSVAGKLTTHMDLLRVVTFPSPLRDCADFYLRLWDANAADPEGRTVFAYEFGRVGELPIFEGADFRSAALRSYGDDSDATIWTLLSFLTLRPGDTDNDYFADYTDAQRAWAESYECEALSCEVLVAQDKSDSEEPPMLFTDVEV